MSKGCRKYDYNMKPWVSGVENKRFLGDFGRASVPFLDPQPWSREGNGTDTACLEGILGCSAHVLGRSLEIQEVLLRMLVGEYGSCHLLLQ